MENDRYIYHISIANLVYEGVRVDFITTKAREHAMMFKKKYMAQAFAKLFKGKVEML